MIRYYFQLLMDWLNRQDPADQAKQPILFVLLPVVMLGLAFVMVPLEEPSISATEQQASRSHIDHRFYFEQVDELVKKKQIDLGKLNAARKAIEDQAKPVPLDPKTAQLTLDVHGVNEAAIRVSAYARFYLRSPLRKDIIDFLNKGIDGQDTFRLNGSGNLMVDASRRRIATPFMERQVWEGRLLFVDRSQRTEPELPSDKPSIQLRVAVNGEECLCQQMEVLTAAVPGSAGSHIISLGADRAPRYELAPRLRLAGRAEAGKPPLNVLETWVTQSGGGMMLHVAGGGDQLLDRRGHPGWVSGTQGPLSTWSMPWPPRDGQAALNYRPAGVKGTANAALTLRLLTAAEAKAQPYTGHLDDNANRLISYLHFLNGTPLRERGAAFDAVDDGSQRAHAFAFVPRLSDAVGELFRMAKKEGVDVQPKVKQDFGITLDPNLQDAIQGALSAGQPHWEMAATVMNERGEILAIADRPLPSVDENGNPVRRPSYSDAGLVNLNFIQHPVGSAGKPILSASCMMAHPELRTFWVAAQPVTGRSGDSAESMHKNILGFQMTRAIEADHKEDSGFTTTPPTSPEVATQQVELAFAKSSNTFFFGQVLASVALSAPGGFQVDQSIPVGYPYQLGLKTFRHRMILPGLDLAAEPPAFGAGLLHAGFVDSFAKNFGIPVQLSDEGMGDRNADEAFGELVEFASAMMPKKAERMDHTQGAVAARLQLLGIAPEHSRQQFFNSIALRDLIMSTIGGSEFGRWTNVDLARCYTRLVTGRAVEATLVRELSPSGEAKRLSPSQLPDLIAHRDLLHRCIRAPIANGKGESFRGTAAVLGDVIDRDAGTTRQLGTDMICYGKTGTFPFNDDPKARKGSFSMMVFYLHPRNTGPEGPGLCCVLSLNMSLKRLDVGLAAAHAANHLLPTLIGYLRNQTR